MKKCFLSFKWADIVCVNKRQMDRFDIRSISIHYITGNKLNELRLKCVSRAEVDEWIRKFRDRGIGRHDFKIPKQQSLEKILFGYRKMPITYYGYLISLKQSLHNVNNRRIFDNFKEIIGVRKIYVDESLRDSDVEIQVYEKNDKSKNEGLVNENAPFISKKESDITKVSYDKMDMTDNSKIRDNSNVTRGKVNVMDFSKIDSRIHSSNK
jgi:hypothetical protein